MSASCKSYYATIIPPAPIMLASPIIHVQTINWCGLLSCPLSSLSCKEITKTNTNTDQNTYTSTDTLIHVQTYQLAWLIILSASYLFPAKNSQTQIQIQIEIRVQIHTIMCMCKLSTGGLLSWLLSSISQILHQTSLMLLIEFLIHQNMCYQV